METPICVVDAKTFVDRIQDIKKWIYSGQLRLIVPSCTIEQVEQLYQKSMELKPTTKEAPRSRSLGKPPKKEYPAFDINPRVAREYLGRSKNRKEQDADSEQRVYFQETENNEALHFQQSNEQYTPWKDLDAEEEKPEALEGPPASWAEALRRKQNLANGISEKMVSKVPTKPKLVARAAGSEVHPWKVKKDTPKISAKDVPGALRPLMSCALWRLHESIERNDANQVFLLSDQTETRSVAQSLNIIIRSYKEVASTIASKTSKTGLETFGDLEREFGIQQKRVFVPIEEANGEDGIPENADKDLFKDEDVMDNSVSSEGTANTDASSLVHEPELEKQRFDLEENKFSVDVDGGEGKAKEHVVETAASLAAENLSQSPAKSFESIKTLVDSLVQWDPEKHLSGSVSGLDLDGGNNEFVIANQPASEHPGQRSPAKTPLPQPQNVEFSQPISAFQTINGTSSSKHTATQSTSASEAAQEPEDSDEEVVVFIPQPKRLSAQQKPAQQGSRPSTPKEQSQQKPASQSPQKASAKPQTKGKAARHSPNPSLVGHAHPQPVISPTVIDPDAFGRDFRVNLKPSHRPQHNPNGHSNHRNRGNISNAQTAQIPRSSSRQLARTSPPRNSPQESSQRLTPVPGPAPKDASKNRRQAPRTSPRAAPAPKAEEVTSTHVESRAPTAAVFPDSQIPQSGMTKSAGSVPQTAFSTAQFQPKLPEFSYSAPRSSSPNAQWKPNTPQPRVYEASEFVPRPPRPVRDSKPRAPRPKVFEASEFVPRDFAPRTSIARAPPDQYLQEPESIEPRPSINDVDYVLKSGSTRASARGRGRLWTPS